MSDKTDNVTSTVNSDVTLTCVNETGRTVRWSALLVNSALSLIVFNGQTVSRRFPRVSERTDEETGDSKLMIDNVQYEDAGNYTCHSRTNHYFTLTVIGS